ncbi:MAG TPA: class I SAM-dependent methyltransferase [Pyrinomonadaceae bacterium]
MSLSQDLQSEFGSIDIYLFDQLLKGRLQPGMSLLDAGCGGGRNLVYFLRHGFRVFGVDQSTEAIAQIRALASQLTRDHLSDMFRIEAVEQMSFADHSFDVVISSAVLHFARDEEHWHSMVDEMWRVLKPGGIFFARLSSTVGIEEQLSPVGQRRYRMPGGHDWFLVDFEMLDQKTRSLRGDWIEPFKTVVVHNLRSMSIWCLRKHAS